MDYQGVFFYQFGGQGTVENEGSLSRCGGFVLAKPELCFLEIPFLCYTGLELDTKEIS